MVVITPKGTLQVKIELLSAKISVEYTQENKIN
jgi:hypothetical protein